MRELREFARALVCAVIAAAVFAGVGLTGALLVGLVLYAGSFAWERRRRADSIADRMDRFRREYEQLGRETPGEQEGVGPVVTDEQVQWNSSVGHLSERVSSELRQNAQGFVAYWRTNPPERLYFQGFGPWAKALIDMSVEQLSQIAKRLREGHDEP